MIRGMIKKRQEQQAELQRQKELAELRERQAWDHHFSLQEALRAQVEASAARSAHHHGRALHITQKDYQQVYQQYKDSRTNES